MPKRKAVKTVFIVQAEELEGVANGDELVTEAVGEDVTDRELAGHLTATEGAEDGDRYAVLEVTRYFTIRNGLDREDD